MTQTNELIVPLNEKRVLMHACCAPCSGPLIEAMQQADIDVHLYYYNPNIAPKQEYERRKEESRRYCKKMDVPFIEGDYDPEHWYSFVQDYEDEPERGKRCTVCFDVRFERTAQYAFENGFSIFTSGLGISRWKNMEQVTCAGEKAAGIFPGLVYWTHNWRKGGGSARMYEIAKEERFYKQEYCGCELSLKRTNAWRASQGKEPVGKTYYEHINQNKK